MPFYVRKNFWTITSLALLAILPLTGSRYSIDLTTQVLIYALFALSLNILVGYLGNLSFGHAAFFSIGGYTCAILLTTYNFPFLISFLTALAFSAIAAFLIGLVCVRRDQMYFAMLTLAFGMLVWAIALKWRPVTGGDDGFVGINIPSILSNPTSFYYFTLLTSTIATYALWTICNSTFGQAMIAIRENQNRALFLGIDTQLIRLKAFVISGIFAGLSGSLFALYNRGMYPESAFWTESGQVLIMVLLGGMHSFIGPILGAIALYSLEIFINQFTEYWQIVLGGILLIVVLIAPEGLAGGIIWLEKKFLKKS